MDAALPTKPHDARGVFISVRLSKTEKREIAAAARRDGLAPATWLRMIALRTVAKGEAR